MTLGSEGGPCPSLLAAEIVTLMLVDGRQREEGTSTSCLQTPSSQGEGVMLEKI